MMCDMMSSVKTYNVRGLSDENWYWLKSVAGFRQINVGDLLNEIIDEWASADPYASGAVTAAVQGRPMPTVRPRRRRARTGA